MCFLPLLEIEENYININDIYHKNKANYLF